MEERTQGFKVTDKRVAANEATAESATSAESFTRRSEEAKTTQEQTRQQVLQEVTFASFILSLSTSALVHLGEIPDPVTQKKEQNLTAAKQLIDILGILKEKTRGNLDKEEDRLIDDLLYELRIKYLESTGQIKR